LFSKALRLQELWFDWTDADRPRNGLPLPVNSNDLLLFHAYTAIKLGNGTKALFWKVPVSVSPLQQRFPSLYQLARRKNLTVKDGVNNGIWMKGLQRINSPELIASFVALCHSMQSVTLLEDSISWTHASDST
jgi:hypothetical protein